MVDLPPPAKPAKTHRGQDMTKSFIEPCAEVCQPVPKCVSLWQSCVMRLFLNSGLMYIALLPGPGVFWPPQRANYNSWFLWLHCSRLAKLGVEAITLGSASLCKRFAIRMLTFIYKGCHEKDNPGYTITFLLTKPVNKKVKIIIFTELTLTLIQFSSSNIR